MNKLLYTVAFLLLACHTIQAQQFIEKASIEFEVKTNLKKNMGSSSWAEMMKENMPQFKTGYFSFTFSNNKSIYKFDRWADGPQVPEFLRKDDEANSYYMDFGANVFNQEKLLYGSSVVVQDSLLKINWKLNNENRIIAGFNCRKATGIINDSVYIFAFYTDEIMISGGPCSINGLPGMILGLTIPRLYTSFIATKVSINGVKEDIIKPVTAKKYLTRSAFRSFILERSKDWGSDDDEDSKKWKNNFLWNALL